MRREKMCVEQKLKDENEFLGEGKEEQRNFGN